MAHAELLGIRVLTCGTLRALRADMMITRLALGAAQDATAQSSRFSAYDLAQRHGHQASLSLRCLVDFRGSGTEEMHADDAYQSAVLAFHFARRCNA